MPRSCSICTNDHLAEIGRAIAKGEPNRSVADRFDGITPSSVQRHKHHMGLVNRSTSPRGNGERIRAPRSNRFASRDENGRCPQCDQITGEGNNALTPEQIIKRAERVLYLSEKIAAKAESNDDARLALSAVDRCQRALEGLMKATGLIGADVQVNIDNRQQSAYISWSTEALSCIQTVHSILDAGGSVQDAVDAVLGHKEAPMLNAPRPEDDDEAA